MSTLSTLSKDTLILLALELNLSDLTNFCRSNKRANDLVCNNPTFWIYKLKKDFNYSFFGKPDMLRNPKKYYNLIKKDVYVDWKARDAVETGDKDLVKYFINRGAKLNWALEKASEREKMDMINFLISEGSKDWKYGLRGAVTIGNLELVNFFLRKGINDFDLIEMGLNVSGGAIRNSKELFDYFLQILKNKNGNIKEILNNHYGPLYEAARASNIDMVTYLIKLGANNWRSGLKGAAGGEKDVALDLVKLFINKIEDERKYSEKEDEKDDLEKEYLQKEEKEDLEEVLFQAGYTGAEVSKKIINWILKNYDVSIDNAIGGAMGGENEELIHYLKGIQK
jgi:hypothetical protein